MSAVRVPCQSCGPVDIPADKVTLRHAVDGDRLEWTCPDCHEPASWRPHPSFRGFLSAAGMQLREVWDVPQEMTDPVRRAPECDRSPERVNLLVQTYARRLAERDDLGDVAAEETAKIEQIRARLNP